MDTDDTQSTINISSFKTHCIRLLKKVRNTGVPLTVTWRGEPLVTVFPGQHSSASRVFEGQGGLVKVTGNIIDNDESSDWESLA
jgi:antitoxin (DNA-binding transcriptional repressor) of toxin-antitoxin stability system